MPASKKIVGKLKTVKAKLDALSRGTSGVVQVHVNDARMAIADAINSAIPATPAKPADSQGQATF